MFSNDNDSKLKNVLDAATSTKQTELIYRLLQIPYQETTAFNALIIKMDQSQFPVASWLQAIEMFVCYLEARSRPVNLPHLIEYLEACAQSVENKFYPLDLKDICTEMLEEYGYVG